MTGPLKGRRALVTGAAGTIGCAVVNELCMAGAKVLALDKSFADFRGFDPSCTNNIKTCEIDLQETDTLNRFCASLASDSEPVNILVNNAGILSNNKLAKTSLEEWRVVSKVNLESAFVLSQNLVPGMTSGKWGRIVNISSYAYKSGGKTAGTSYSVSKAGLVGLTFAIAREVAAHGVTVNAIAPAYVMSPMVSKQLTEAQRRHQLSEIPVGRFCAADEVAHTVGFLTSPRAGFITGEVIDMNGGMHFD